MNLDIPCRPSGPRYRPVVAVAAALLLCAASVVALAGPSMAATGCRVTYLVNQWAGGFTATVELTNLGDPLTGWTIEWDYPDPGQRVTAGWSAAVDQAGTHVRLRNASWNGAVGTASTVRAGVMGSWTTANPAPQVFVVNGYPCTEVPPGSSTSSS